MRRFGIGLIVAALLACGAGLLGMAPASAATTIHVTCTERSITIYGVVGDEFTFTTGGSCTSAFEFFNTADYVLGPHGWLERVSGTGTPSGASTDNWYEYLSNGGSTLTVRLMGVNWTATPLPPAGSQIAEFDNDSAGLVGGYPTIVIPIIYGGTTPPTASGGWTVRRQALPMPHTGNCDAVADADYVWGTNVRGGWLKVWEPWAGIGVTSGGWACARALVNKGGSTWSVDNSVL